MKVYEIRKFGGEYELAWDEHVTAYFSKEKAEACLVKLNEQRNKDVEQRIQCYECPIFRDPSLDEKRLLMIKAKYHDKECIQKVRLTHDWDGCVVSSCGDCLDDIPDGYYINDFEVEE